MQVKKRIRYRIDRKKEADVLDDSGHLWAVSYSDLLMVLLSFFVVFFSIDGEKESIRQILQVADIPAVNSIDNKVLSSTKTESLREVLILIKPIQDLEVLDTGSGEEVLINFPENIYARGETRLSKKYERQLLAIFQSLEPHIEKLRIEFIGHSDSAPIRSVSSSRFQDNFDLSFYRAAEALRIVVASGFARSDQLSAKGLADNQASNRGLSILISQRQTTP